VEVARLPPIDRHVRAVECREDRSGLSAAWPALGSVGRIHWSDAFPLRFDKRRRMLHLSKPKGSMVDADRMELPQGTLDLLVLKTLALEPLHGWAVSERLGQMSGRAVQVRQGSLYPALHRLERRGWIRARWGTSENNRRARYYELTRVGRKQLDAEVEAWRRLTTVISQVLDTL
jgi:PadR family transcriptional regulator PadR